MPLKQMREYDKKYCGHVMIWSRMPFIGVGESFIESNMNAKQCINTFRDNLCNSALKLGISYTYYFQQANNLKHTTCKKSIANDITITRPQSHWKFMANFGYGNLKKENF